METKKTIAILGLEKGIETPFLDALANENRLLILSEESNDCAKVSDYISQTRLTQEVELMNCPKDGCWEADIILIWNPSQHKPENLRKLQSVAIQKIVVIVSNEETIELPPFPHSKVVLLTLHPPTSQAHINGDDFKAVEAIYQIINRTGVLKISMDGTAIE